jgi:hypothetical protein
MKIKYAIHGSNNNPLYLDFWPVISKVWREKFNVIPVLGLVGNEDGGLYDDGNGLVLKVKLDETHDSALSSQIVRMYATKYFDDNCIISDIDMIPISKKYFIDQFEEFTNDDILVMSSHHPQMVKINQYPMCYVVGQGKKLSKIFDCNTSWPEFYQKIPKLGWYSDQVYLYECISKYGTKNIKFPFRSFNGDRIDRMSWSYNIDRLNAGEYIDCHSLRPYNIYKKQVDDLISLIN